MGMSDHGMDQVKLNVISGYQINPYFSLGIGVGLRYYFDEKTVLIPVFADFRVNFIDNKISPYLSLGIGYSFDTKADFEGEGFLLNPTVGVTFKISEKSALNFGFWIRNAANEVSLL
jgi:long-subunit fatty acid transport protein